MPRYLPEESGNLTVFKPPEAAPGIRAVENTDLQVARIERSIARSKPTDATRISTSSGLVSWVKTWPSIWAY